MSCQVIKEKKIGSKYNPKDLFRDEYDYNVWSENVKESTDKEESTTDGTFRRRWRSKRRKRIKNFNLKEIIS